MPNRTCKQRKRGGQPGNNNAKRHGFYSKDGNKDIIKIYKIILECKEYLNKIDFDM